MGKRSLDNAKSVKEDEFYTQLSDIEEELRHYKKHFEGKTVFCNCDDPYESNFFKYFAMNFNQLKLKKLIATCYDGSPVAEQQLSIFEEDNKKTKTGVPHKITITEVTDVNGDGAINLGDVEWLIKNDKNVLTRLDGNGDFRSKECLELLQEADIVVSNPPFSLFREYIGQLVDNGKQFLIVGNQNAITYKEVFKLIKDNKVWLGFKCGNMEFKVPDYYQPKPTRFWIDESGQKWRSLGNICWFTNLDHSKRHDTLDLFKMYNPDDYPFYENFDGVNCNKVEDIPIDYDGVIGVPITFLDKYNPDQFDIIGLGISNSGLECGVRPYQPEHKKYRKEIQKRGAVDGDLYMMIDGVVTVPFARILIRKK